MMAVPLPTCEFAFLHGDTSGLRQCCCGFGKPCPQCPWGTGTYVEPDDQFLTAPFTAEEMRAQVLDQEFRYRVRSENFL